MPNTVLLGFVDLADNWKLPVATVEPQTIEDAINISVQEHNRQANALLGLFAETTTDFKLRYRSRGFFHSQPVDDLGHLISVRPAFTTYEIGLPYQWSGNAWGLTRIRRMSITVEEINDILVGFMVGDLAWMREHLLAALFDNTSRTFVDPDHGNLVVYPLANGDSTLYLPRTGLTTQAAANHYMAQAGAIADGANPFPLISATLINRPENGGDVFVMIPTNLVASVEALSTFYVRDNPRLVNTAGHVSLTGIPDNPTPGVYLGYESAGNVDIFTWNGLPSNYMIAFTTDGDRPLKQRLHELSELQGGFIPWSEREDTPYWEKEFRRVCGFGAWNRVGAVVYQIGNGTYQIPANYAQVMP